MSSIKPEKIQKMVEAILSYSFCDKMVPYHILSPNLKKLIPPSEFDLFEAFGNVFDTDKIESMLSVQKNLHDKYHKIDFLYRYTRIKAVCSYTKRIDYNFENPKKFEGYYTIDEMVEDLFLLPSIISHQIIISANFKKAGDEEQIIDAIHQGSRLRCKEILSQCESTFVNNLKRVVWIEYYIYKGVFEPEKYKRFKTFWNEVSKSDDYNAFGFIWFDILISMLEDLTHSSVEQSQLDSIDYEQILKLAVDGCLNDYCLYYDSFEEDSYEREVVYGLKENNQSLVEEIESSMQPVDFYFDKDNIGNPDYRQFRRYLIFGSSPKEVVMQSLVDLFDKSIPVVAIESENTEQPEIATDEDFIFPDDFANMKPDLSIEWFGGLQTNIENKYLDKFGALADLLADKGYIDNTPNEKRLFIYRFTGRWRPEGRLKKIGWHKGQNVLFALVRKFIDTDGQTIIERGGRFLDGVDFSKRAVSKEKLSDTMQKLLNNIFPGVF